MQNLYETLRSGLLFNKFEVGELLFVEYSCPLEDESFGVWSQIDHLVHILSGTKTWRTTNGSWTVSTGDTIFIKKGASVVEQNFDEEFCMLGFFISDDFIRDIVKEVSGNIDVRPTDRRPRQSVITVKNDVILSTYFESMLPYFGSDEKPSDSLLVVKLKELIINILTGSTNPPLSDYFQSIAGADKPSIQQIMDDNYCFNLSLEEFAKLCNRSVSSFKRDFKRIYDTSPGKWLRAKRLEYSTVLLKNNGLNVTQVAYECGFEDSSHFSRAFKERFGLSPLRFRKEVRIT